MMNTVLGIIAFLAALVGLAYSSAATVGLGIIGAFYVMFKVSYCFRMLEHQEKEQEWLKAIGKQNKQIVALLEKLNKIATDSNEAAEDSPGKSE